MNKKNKQITKKLIQIRKNIKAKLNAIKSDNFQTEQALKPLKHLITTSIQPSIKKENIVKIESDKSNIVTTPTNIKNLLSRKKDDNEEKDDRTPEKLRLQFIEDDTIYEHNPIDGSFFDETFTSEQQQPTNQSIIDSVPEQSFLDYLEQYDELPRQYIAGHIRDTQGIYDHHYLSHNLETDKIKFGDSELNFNGSDIIIKGKTFHGTRGLYELLFKNIPNHNFITPDDTKMFKEILLTTNAHRRSFKENEQVAGNRGEKYRFVIKPILTAIEQDKLETAKQHKTKLRISTRTGSGLLMRYNENPIDYIHWNDPNELVERLRLLIASQYAGNNNHTNEINSIIEELREANIIY